MHHTDLLAPSAMALSYCPEEDDLRLHIQQTVAAVEMPLHIDADDAQACLH